MDQNPEPHADLLGEAFAAHEHLAPSAPEVLTQAHRLARTYRRRRRGLQATGGAVLGAGVVVGSVNGLPSLLHRPVHHDVVQTFGAGGPAATPTAAPVTQEEELQAYFNAGYSYHEAEQLAALWHSSADLVKVKAEAGGKLLAGETLPVQPSSDPIVQTPQDKAVTAFFNAGYDYNDAVKLGQLWNETDTFQVKAEAGQKLLDGETLPIAK